VYILLENPPPWRAKESKDIEVKGKE